MEEPSTDQSSYYPDPNSIEELFRLLSQDTYMNQRLRYSQPKENTLLPPSFIPEPGMKILDLGCGPGGWVLEAAQIFPMSVVTGIDINERRIEFAKKQAIAVNTPNAEFILGNFAELEKYVQPESVDFLHARLLKWFSPNYKQLVKKWLTRVRAGGILCLVEGEGPITNSEAFDEVLQRVSVVLARQQPDEMPAGFQVVTPHLQHMLQDLHLVEIQEVAHVINFSAGAKGRGPFLMDITDGLQSIAHQLMQRGGLTEQESNHLIQRCIADLWENPAFRGIQYFLSIYGNKM